MHNSNPASAADRRGSWAVGLTALACLALTPADALADDFNLIGQKWQLSLGTFINESDLEIRFDGVAGDEGTPVDWGNTFGKKDATRFRLDGVWRFSEKHHLRLLYTDFSRSRTETLQEDIEWNGETLPVNASATATLGFEIYELAYEYAFLQAENYEVAAGIGLHYTTFEASLRATIDSPTGGGSTTVGGPASVDAPLPVIGAHGMWRVGGDFYLDGLAQFFALSIDEYDGSIINYRAALIWQPKKAFGLGVGYDYFNIDVDVDGSKFKGSMDWTYSGPQIFLNFTF